MATKQPKRSESRSPRPKSAPVLSPDQPERSPSTFVSEILTNSANYAPKSLHDAEIASLSSQKEHEDRKWFKHIFGLWFVVFIIIVVPIIILLVYILENMYQAKNEN